MNYEIITENDEKYPKKLHEIKNHPKKLHAMGNFDLLNKNAIAIVGSRDCNKYGIQQARRFAGYLSQKNLCIVSGLARGIDTIAHEHSMKNKGRTIAVIASGFKHIYPKENQKLFDDILKNDGLIISEWEPNIKVDMQRFPRRNRIISGMTAGTLVIQSKYRSGSNITAHSAMKQGREVFCIPRKCG